MKSLKIFQATKHKRNPNQQPRKQQSSQRPLRYLLHQYQQLYQRMYPTKSTPEVWKMLNTFPEGILRPLPLKAVNSFPMPISLTVFTGSRKAKEKNSQKVV